MMVTYEALSAMFAFGMLIVAIIALVFDHSGRNK